MEKKERKMNMQNLQDLAMNVVFASFFLDLYNKFSDSRKFALSCDLIMNYFVEKHEVKELNFDLFFSLLDSHDGDKNSAIFLAFLENATKYPYKATESISLTLTEY